MQAKTATEMPFAIFCTLYTGTSIKQFKMYRLSQEKEETDSSSMCGIYVKLLFDKAAIKCFITDDNNQNTETPTKALHKLLWYTQLSQSISIVYSTTCHSFCSISLATDEIFVQQMPNNTQYHSKG